MFLRIPEDQSLPLSSSIAKEALHCKNSWGSISTAAWPPRNDLCVL